MKVVLRKRAQNSISSIADYIEQKGYPDTSYKFSVRIEEFSNALKVFPLKYPICRFEKFTIRNLRCAVFENNYIFIYKAVKQKIIIYNVVHCKRLM